MRKSIKVHPKKRRGRPATGKDPLISARVPQSLIDEIEEWSKRHGATRSEAIRRLIEAGLNDDDDNADGARSMIERALKGERK
jgi:Arc/MetJ-type ribon-helix-helix transcriptional regulator